MLWGFAAFSSSLVACNARTTGTGPSGNATVSASVASGWSCTTETTAAGEARVCRADSFGATDGAQDATYTCEPSSVSGSLTIRSLDAADLACPPPGSGPAGSSGGSLCTRHGAETECVNAEKPTNVDPSSPSPEEDVDGCWVTGGGFVASNDGHDSFGGNAKPMKNGAVQGQWEHVDHGTGRKGHGEPKYLVCRKIDAPGPGAPKGTLNQAFFGGPARWFDGGQWSDGYWFDVVVEDRGEGKGGKAGGPDHYRYTVRKDVDVATGRSGVIVYEVSGDQGGGNLQLHAANAGHPASTSVLPAWVQP